MFNTDILNYPKITVGFSGGMDSVVLLHWLVSQGYNVDALHVVHIPEERQYADFCKKFCARYNIAYRVVEGDIGRNSEKNARNFRYDIFAKNDHPVAVAHHQNDQTETFLFKLFRGAGINGLTGMKSVSMIHDQTILRPMLSCSKVDIENYIKEHNLEYIDDITNNESVFDRNFIRNELLPLIKSRFPYFSKNIEMSMQLLQDSLELNNDLALIDISNVEIDNHWDLRKMQNLSDSRIKNMVICKLRMLSSYSYSDTTLQSFVNMVRNNNPDKNTMISFKPIIAQQKGYRVFFK